MFANSRRLLPIFQSLLPGDQSIFRSHAGDFAIGFADDPSAAIAFLAAIRPSHRALRIDGTVGRISLPDGAAPDELKTTVAYASVTHILNVRELAERCFLEDDRLEEGIAGFLAALDQVLRRVRDGEDLKGMMPSPRSDIFIAPLA